MSETQMGLRRILQRAIDALEPRPGMRVLDLGCGDGAAALALRAAGSAVAAVDLPSPVLQAFAARAAPLAPGLEVAPLGSSVAAVSGRFAAALLEGSLLFAGRSLGAAAAQVHPLLDPLSRIAALGVLRVGQAAAGPVEALGRGQGVAPLFPREAAEVLEAAGYEPLSIELFEPALLEAHCRELERRADADRALRSGAELLRDPGMRASVGLGLLVARRREPGEVPPLARGDG